MAKSKNTDYYNRLILIGNGFDIALGLKTSYTDFILDYMKKVFIEALTVNNTNSGLVKTPHNYGVIRNKEKWVDIIQGQDDLKGLIERMDFIQLSYNYDFMKEIVTKSANAKWVDIETLYFRHLKLNFLDQLSKRVEGTRDYSKVQELNVCMDKLAKALEEYIIEEQSKQKISYLNSSMSSLIDRLFLPMEKKDLDLLGVDGGHPAPENVIFLNFNYTNSVLSLFNNSFTQNARHIFIHGSVSSEDSLIFGYGDDTNSDYNKIEAENDNELLRKIKSFQYPKTSNYHKLLNIIEAEKFEVMIVGHSCGMSDKTMLKTIFESDNCIAIKNFHYLGEPEDFEKRMAISRHFEDKALMRKRLLPFDQTATIPQT